MPVVNLISSSLQGPQGQQSYRQLEKGIGADLTPSEASGSTGVEEGRPLKPGFLDMVRSFIGDVNDLQNRSDRATEAFAAGEITDVHQVTVAAQEASLALDLLLEVRNKTVEAFQEIMRMQV